MMNAVKLNMHGCMQKGCERPNAQNETAAAPEKRLKVMLGNLIGFFIEQYADRYNTHEEVVESLCGEIGTDEAELKALGIDLSKEDWEEKLSQDIDVPQTFGLRHMECLLRGVVNYEVSQYESGDGTEQAAQNLREMGFSAEEMSFFGFPKTAQ